MTSEVSLSEWVDFVFDHPVTESVWYFSAGAPYLKVPPARAAALIAETFEGGRVLLEPFSDGQLNQAFWFLLNGNSDYMFSLTEATVAWPVRRRALRSFVPLFREVMAARCTPSLSHLDESGASPLNSACYMWWDLMPISAAPGKDARQGPSPLQDEVVAVLAELLDIPHDACRESALHGLGHWSHVHPKASAVIDEFLARSQGLRPELLQYARQARTGCIQ